MHNRRVLWFTFAALLVIALASVYSVVKHPPYCWFSPPVDPEYREVWLRHPELGCPLE